jgi:tRNA dimethylallyltransferase
MTLLDPIYVVGPTAVGKSEVAVALAERLDGEVVGADAFQIYRGLDLLTAKPDAATRAHVPHHLIGEIPLVETFDVARYRSLALARFAEIGARGRVPVVVGGTGLYVRALTHGLAALPGTDPVLRAQLEAQPLAELVRQLSQHDPAAAAQMDLKNPRRVIRALEVCLLTGRPFSSFRKQAEPERPARGVLLLRERTELNARIDQRTVQMFAAGVIEEVRAASEVSATAAQAIGFREIRALLRGDISEAECVARIQQQTRNYAKRQLTWFRREPHFTALVLTSEDSPAGVVQRCVELLRR